MTRRNLLLDSWDAAVLGQCVLTFPDVERSHVVHYPALLFTVFSLFCKCPSKESVKSMGSLLGRNYCSRAKVTLRSSPASDAPAADAEDVSGKPLSATILA